MHTVIVIDVVPGVAAGSVLLSGRIRSPVAVSSVPPDRKFLPPSLGPCAAVGNPPLAPYCCTRSPPVTFVHPFGATLELSSAPPVTSSKSTTCCAFAATDDSDVGQETVPAPVPSLLRDALEVDDDFDADDDDELDDDFDDDDEVDDDAVGDLLPPLHAAIRNTAPTVTTQLDFIDLVRIMPSRYARAVVPMVAAGRARGARRGF